MTTTPYSLLLASILSSFSLWINKRQLGFLTMAALQPARLIDAHECNANHSQSNHNNLLSLVRRPRILGAFFFWMMATDRDFPGLHARGGVCPRHAEEE